MTVELNEMLQQSDMTEFQTYVQMRGEQFWHTNVKVNPHSLQLHDQLGYKGDALVVMGNNSLKRGVIQLFHNIPSSGHPGIANTRALISRDYCTISTDRSWYVTRYLTCSRNTSFMTLCYPLQPEKLFILRSRNEKSHQLLAVWGSVVEVDNFEVNDHLAVEVQSIVPHQATVSGRGQRKKKPSKPFGGLDWGLGRVHIASCTYYIAQHRRRQFLPFLRL